ncbi:MAG: aminomethyl-transferring glycine dehydrogenase, partial [Christensenella sp.]|nr:aminomethyl-transferring glycine dehydrogenase [Christensenella sp.]
LGEGILQRSAYAKKKLAEIKGIDIPLEGFSYCDFLVNFDGTKKTVEQINKELLTRNIIGGKDVSKTFPAYGQSALFGVTEMNTQEDIDTLVTEISDICGA